MGPAARTASGNLIPKPLLLLPADARAMPSGASLPLLTVTPPLPLAFTRMPSCK
jgi:hypothetical protein